MTDIAYDDDELSRLVLTTADYLRAWGYEIPEELKTVEWYRRTLWRNVRDLYNQEIDVQMFLNFHVDIVREQLRRAWNEGMRENGLDPERDMKPEWEARLQNIMVNELMHMEDFANAVGNAAILGEPIEPFRARVDLWANRYNDVVNEAKLLTKPEDRYRWVYGDTEHCETCAHLNGIVATATQWADSGYIPGHPPNNRLECGGWRCQCRLERTDAPLTEGGIR